MIEMLERTPKPVLAILLALLLVIGVPVFAQTQQEQTQQEQAQQEQQAQLETAQSVQPEVEADLAQQAQQMRQKIVQDAVAALEATQRALSALEQNDTDGALAELETALGKLELILAREPSLALAPVDVQVVVRDLYADPETVREVVKNARDLLDEGRVQEARPLLTNLASEIAFITTNLPLATYPEAIKDAVRLIDVGRTEEAMMVLETALNTLVIAEQAEPLPLLRSQILLDVAQPLAQNDQRSPEENQRLAELLQEVRTQVELAEALGYGQEADFELIYDQLEELEKRANSGESGQDWFDTLRERIANLF